MNALDPRRRIPLLAVCFAGLAFEGYDLVSYGTVLPRLMGPEGWGLGPATAGLIGTVTVIGMLIGSMLSGALADVIGRRRSTLTSCAWFSAWMAVCAAAPTIEVLGTARFLAGLGIGAFVPLVAALAVESAPDGRGNRYSAIAWSGYPIGGVIAAFIGVIALDPLGWRFLFALGALPVVSLVPVMFVLIPHDVPRSGPAPRPGAQAPAALDGARSLFVDGVWLRTVIFGLMSASGLVLTYGLNTWLPQLMRANGYELGSALTFLMALNLGAAVVPPLLARYADRSGPRTVMVVVFLAAAASILALSVALPLGLVYVLVFVAGAGTLGAQLLMSGFVATDYPSGSRVAALSWISCVGRIGALVGPTLIGLLVAMGNGVATSFYVFAAFGVLGAVLAAAIPRRPSRWTTADVETIAEPSDA